MSADTLHVDALFTRRKFTREMTVTADQSIVTTDNHLTVTAIEIATAQAINITTIHTEDTIHATAATTTHASTILADTAQVDTIMAELGCA